MRKLIDIDDKILMDLKIMAVKSNKDLKNFIQDLLVDYVDENKGKPNE